MNVKKLFLCLTEPYGARDPWLKKAAVMLRSLIANHLTKYMGTSWFP
jgi:hypothetical protein